MKDTKIFTVGITGASGVIYGVRLVQELLKLKNQVHLVITDAGWQVLKQELDWDTQKQEELLNTNFAIWGEGLNYHHLRDFHAPIASGSFQTDGMVIIPCSMGTLSGVAQGSSGNLLERAADVVLKEGKKLLVVPRETPLNVIHIENMLKLSQAGAKILPAMPGFYHKPTNLSQLIDHLVGKVLDNLGIEHTLFKRWGSD